MPATVSAKNAFLRSDGLFFITADTVEGDFQRGDILTVPIPNCPDFRASIDLIIFIANKDGNQQSLVFKNLESYTIVLLTHTVTAGLILRVQDRDEQVN